MAFGKSGSASSCLQTYHNTAVSNTAVLVQAGHQNLYGGILENEHSSAVYIQFFDKATAGEVTLGTTTPNFSIRLPASGGVVLDRLAPLKHFYYGCVIAVTATRTGNWSPTAAACITLFYQVA